MHPVSFVFLTGQYHWRLKGADRLGGSLQADVPVYPDLLAEAGYLVGFSRKGAEPSKHLFRGNDPFGKQYKNFDQFWQPEKRISLFVIGMAPGNRIVRTRGVRVNRVGWKLPKGMCLRGFRFANGEDRCRRLLSTNSKTGPVCRRDC